MAAKSSPRRIAAFAALLTGALAALLAHLYLSRYEQQYSGGEPVAILTLLKDVPGGTALTSDMVGVRLVPTAYYDDRAVLSRDKDKVLGINTVLPLKAQQSLLWTDVATRTDIRNLSELVKPGKRAVAIRVDRHESTANRLIRPGDYADIIATLPGKDQDLRSILLLQRLLIVAVGLRTERLNEDPKAGNNDDTLTVSVDIEEAQLLRLATQRGSLSVAVRNADDERIYQDLPDMPSESLLQVRDALQARKRRPSSTSQLPVKITDQ